MLHLNHRLTESQLRWEKIVEKTKTKLQDTRYLHEKIFNKIEKLEDDFKKDKKEWSQKLKTLKNIQINQLLRLSKVDDQINSIEKALKAWKLKERNLLETLVHLKKESDEIKGRVKVFEKDLEVANRAWMMLENYVDQIDVKDLSLSLLGEESKTTTSSEKFEKFKKLAQKNQREIYEELAAAEEAEGNMERQIESKKQELAVLKEELTKLSEIKQRSQQHICQRKKSLPKTIKMKRPKTVFSSDLSRSPIGDQMPFTSKRMRQER